MELVRYYVALNARYDVGAGVRFNEFSERASICSRQTSEMISRKMVRPRAHFVPRPIMRTHAWSDWKLVVKLKTLLSISGP